MAVVRRIFRMIGTQGAAIRGVKKTFEREGPPTPEGKRVWGQFFIREAVNDDAYRPHTREEIEALVAKGQMARDVAARLDPKKRYGIWWFNKRRTKRYQVAVNGPDGKTYKKRAKITTRPEAEWIAVPVPDSGVPREWIDLAREAIKNNKKFSQAGRREWQLSGGLARCAECGWAMRCLTSHDGGRRIEGKKISFYYYCSRVSVGYEHDPCPNRKSHRVDRVEPLVWEYVSGVMKDPDGLRTDIDRMIELERGTRRDPGGEAERWAGKLAEVDRKRARYQEMAASDLITLDELRSKLTELEETRGTAERELGAVRGQEERVRDMERDRDALVGSLEAMAPEVLDSLTIEERHQWYKLLRLRAAIRANGDVEVRWAGASQGTAVCETASLPRQATL